MAQKKLDRISVVVPKNPFTPQGLESVRHCLCALDVEKLMEWWPGLFSVTEASRDDYPDLQNVQILAFQRIVAFQDFLDESIPNNRFWKAHRRPSWCRDSMIYRLEEQNIEQPEAA
jgi:hypothetical protein